MNFQQFDLNLLVALDALLQERNITEAGRRVYLSQSAMSGALARLREYFGDEILTQVGRRMVPTPLAESLAEPVREILLKTKATLVTKPAFDPATSTRRFRLMMSDYVSTVLMPQVYRQVETTAPNVQFETLSADVPSPFDALDRAELDFLVMPVHLLNKSHPTEPLYDESFVCIVSADNPLVGDSITAEQYLALGHVGLQLVKARSPIIDEWFLTRLGIARRFELVVMSFNSLPLAVVGTRRIATIQRRLAEFYARYLPLRILDAPYELPIVTEAMQWHVHFDRDPGSLWLRGVFREAAKRIFQPSAPTSSRR